MRFSVYSDGEFRRRQETPHEEGFMLEAQNIPLDLRSNYPPAKPETFRYDESPRFADYRSCQTPTASPAEPGDHPTDLLCGVGSISCTFCNARYIYSSCEARWLEDAPFSDAFSKKCWLAENGAVWISWPKAICEIVANLGRKIVYKFATKNGLAGVKGCSIDRQWVAVKFILACTDRDAGRKSRKLRNQ